MTYKARCFRMMSVSLALLSLCVAAVGALLIPLASAQENPTSTPQVDVLTMDWLAQADVVDITTVLVTFHDTAMQAQADAAQTIPDRTTRRAQVYAALQRQAEEHEAAMQAFLQEHGLEADYQVFIASNSIAVTGAKPVVEALRDWTRVRVIELDAPVQLIKPVAEEPAPEVSSAAVEWGISQINADRVHTELGITGKSVVVGGLDSGVRHTHEAMRANYKCASQNDHRACWLDTVNGRAVPYDDNGHGTHSLGSTVGQGGIGVAPGATWIACKALDASGSGSSTGILKCIDWFLAPGGDPANAPDVVNNSWGSDNGSRTVYVEALRNWVNAGIVPVFSNGNNGEKGCNTVGSPGSYKHVIGVGATDNNDQIASFSSRGPSPFGVVKPDLSAPGVRVRSALGNSNTAYGLKSGTSMAAPHVTGLVALLLEAKPDLSIEQIKMLMTGQALQINASACNSKGIPNNVFGWGRIRAYESVRAALANAPTLTSTTVVPPIPTMTPRPNPTRTITFTVTDGWDASTKSQLSANGKVALITNSDDQWWNIMPGSFTVFQFNAQLPQNAAIKSVVLSIEHHEDAIFTSNRLMWQVGGGSLQSPSVTGSFSPGLLLGETREAAVQWDVTRWMQNAATVNDLKLQILNNDSMDQQTWIDQITLEVTYTGGERQVFVPLLMR
jgi:subtilisin family serine protease